MTVLDADRGDVPARARTTQLWRSLAAMRRRMFSWLPEGRTLPTSMWLRRHRAITRFALFQAVAVSMVGVVLGNPLIRCVADVFLVGVPALVGAWAVPGRRLRTNATTMSLMLASATLVDLCGPITEAHFHFFVMLGVVALYSDWIAFGVCFLVIVAHHAVMGELMPHAIYGNTYQWQDPIRSALIYGGFLLAASVTHLIAWKANERQELSDPLTRLANRTAFLESLDRRLAIPDQAVSVLFIDLDNFKMINDSAGHHIGDLALKHAAQRMMTVMRAGDLVARLGGDEFAVLVNGDVDDATSVGNRISAQLQDPISVDGREILINASIGAADSVLAGSRDSADLLRDADLAMYLAKAAGKNQVVTYTAGVDRIVTERASLAVDIRLALLREQFELRYQPLMRDNVVFGAEALLRWHHPTRGDLSPDEFIPIAEEAGEIIAIGTWVLRTAVAQVAAWRRDAPGCADLTLAVNLSPVQLRSPGLIDVVAEVLSAFDLPPNSLTLEVTEGILLENLDLTRSQIDAIRYFGVLVAIDDFGTGYSSLSHLATLPADQIKIDKSFVATLANGSESVALVKAIIDVAHALNLEIMAEGVEYPAQRDLLAQLGCTATQGFLYSQPLTAADFTTFVVQTSSACAA